MFQTWSIMPNPILFNCFHNLEKSKTHPQPHDVRGLFSAKRKVERFSDEQFPHNTHNVKPTHHSIEFFASPADWLSETHPVLPEILPYRISTQRSMTS